MIYAERCPGTSHRGDVDDPSRAAEVNSDGNRATRLPEPFVNAALVLPVVSGGDSPRPRERIRRRLVALTWAGAALLALPRRSRPHAAAGAGFGPLPRRIPAGGGVGVSQEKPPVGTGRS
jgi:hypothetical protein